MGQRVVSMEARLGVAILLQDPKTSVTDLARELGVSRQFIYNVKARFEEGGIEGLVPLSRAPLVVANRIPRPVERRIIELREELVPENGPGMIWYHLCREALRPLPRESTVWRVLRRHGLIEDQPEKRPKSAIHRFQYDNPNDCWQFDATTWPGSEFGFEIMSCLDDCSRQLMACRAVASATTEAAWELFCTASQAYGLPVMALSDNGLAFSGKLRGFEVAFERNLRELGVRAVTSRPYHPQTCGKIERFHQTLKKWLRAQHWVWADLEAFQCALDRFREFYNERRPHRALGGHTPGE